jgi:hypothetical protein
MGQKFLFPCRVKVLVSGYSRPPSLLSGRFVPSNIWNHFWIYSLMFAIGTGHYFFITDCPTPFVLHTYFLRLFRISFVRHPYFLLLFQQRKVTSCLNDSVWSKQQQIDDDGPQFRVDLAVKSFPRRKMKKVACVARNNPGLAFVCFFVQQVENFLSVSCSTVPE